MTTDAMRIALVGTRGVPARYGGFETCVEEVGRRLVARGHEVTVYCRRGEDTAEPEHFAGMRLVHLPAMRRRSLETLSHTGLSMAHLLRHRPDVAIVFNAANSPWLPAVRAAGVPVATHVDGLEWQRAKWGPVGQRYYRVAEALAVRWSDALIADANGIAEYYRAEFGAGSDLIAYGAPVVPDASDRLAELGLEPGGYHLVVARFEPENHVHVLVDGYRRSRATLPLVVVGSAPYADAYTARVHELADDRVRFLGAVWDQELLDQLYAGCLTYGHGHSVGGTNPSLLRALGAGAPCLAYDVSFNREVLADAGAYFRTAADVAAHLEAAEADPGAQARRGVAARARASAYDWDDVAESYERLCRRLVAAGPQRLRPSGRRRGATRAAASPVTAAPAGGGDPDRRAARQVVLIHPSPDLYGSDRQLVESVVGLASAGWRTTVLLPVDGPLRPVLERHGAEVRVVEFPVLRRALLKPRALARLAVRTPSVLRRLRAELAASGAAAVYVNTLTVPHCVVAARLAGLAVLCHSHEAERVARPLQLALTAPLLLADRVVANSESTRSVLTTTVPRLSPRVTVVPNGVPDAGVPAPLRARHPGDELRLALVSRLSPRKGIHVAVDAVTRLRAAGRRVRLDVYGSTFPGYEWYEEQLRATVRERGLADVVTLHGFVPDTRPALEAADGVLVPSFGESFGNVAVEGMLAGRPVIASDVQGLAEVLTDGHSGLLVRPGSVEELADAIARLADDPALAARLAAAGRLRARTEFAVAEYHERMARVVAATARAGTDGVAGPAEAPLSVVGAAAGGGGGSRRSRR